MPLAFPPSTNPYALPDKSEILSSVNKMLSLLDSGAESGGVFYWFNPSTLLRDIDNLYATQQNLMPGGPPAVEQGLLCFLNAVFALAAQCTTTGETDEFGWKVPAGSVAGYTPDQRYSPSISTPGVAGGDSQGSYFSTYPPNSAPAGITFFARAKALMVNPSDAPSLMTLKTLSIFAYYLASAHRWEAAFLHIGLAVRLSVGQGLHRRTASGSVGAMSDREREERNRTFWTVYVIDRMICALLGRPVMLGDNMIDLEMPREVVSSNSFPPPHLFQGL